LKRLLYRIKLMSLLQRHKDIGSFIDYNKYFQHYQSIINWCQFSRKWITTNNKELFCRFYGSILFYCRHFGSAIQSGANFTNTLRAAFAPMLFCQKKFKKKQKVKKINLLLIFLYEKGARKMLVKLIQVVHLQNYFVFRMSWKQ